MYLLYCVKMYCLYTLSEADDKLLVILFKPFDFFQ